MNHADLLLKFKTAESREDSRHPHAEHFAQFCSTQWQDSEVYDQLITDHFLHPINLYMIEAISSLYFLLFQPPTLVEMIYETMLKMPIFAKGTHDLHIRDCNVHAIRSDTFEFILVKHPRMMRDKILYKIISARPELTKYLFDMAHPSTPYLVSKLMKDDHYYAVSTLFQNFEAEMRFTIDRFPTRYFKLILKSSGMVELVITKVPEIWEKISISGTFKECKCHISILELFRTQLATNSCSERSKQVFVNSEEKSMRYPLIKVLNHLVNDDRVILEKYQDDHVVKYNLKKSKNYIHKTFFPHTC